MSTTITRDEWLSEFERVMRQQPKGDPGLTSDEIADALHVGPHHVTKMLRAVAKRGQLICGRKPGVAIDGRRVMSPCYQLVTERKAAKRR